jgi:hypothetical protein
MLFRETVAVYCENHMEHTDTLCWQNAEFGVLKQVVHIVTTGPSNVKHSSSIVAPIISMGMCLSDKASPSNGSVYLLIKNLLPNSECCFVVCFEVATQQRFYTLQYYS